VGAIFSVPVSLKSLVPNKSISESVGLSNEQRGNMTGLGRAFGSDRLSGCSVLALVSPEMQQIGPHSFAAMGSWTWD
jgi:hypothetical protein